ncbi:glutamate racemase [Acidaminobacter sp. JC074]|uniref:glutamate racemase n=1 Tax=Acidaminobacter sp. JC074 TaxID=2530199 RepID=UPI001F10CAF1|nr:glutamate racemase [Acidaminobacter sp. JC074]MCH4887379.1 glutamate racemase [Acidaminobacter sp. JC074]
MLIGIFDSGMGGLSVLYEAKKRLPNESFIYFGDSKNAPYGIKTKEEVIERCIEICDYLMTRHVDAIVVACNTATSAAIKVLRDKYPIPIIGMEPALKPAVESNKGKAIAVMATPMTLKEEKFNDLLNKVASSTSVYKVPAPKIVELIEEEMLESEEILPVLEAYFRDIKDNIESVVLGCTHYLFIKDFIYDLLGQDIELIDGNLGTVNQLKKKLLENNYKSEENRFVEIINSAGKSKVDLSKKLLKVLEEKYGDN